MRLGFSSRNSDNFGAWREDSLLLSDLSDDLPFLNDFQGH